MSDDVLARPRSAASPWAGGAGAIACVLAILTLRDWPMHSHERSLAVLVAVAAVMVVIEGITRPPVRPVVSGARAWRVLSKTIGVAVTAGAVAMAAWLLPEYYGEFYDPCTASLRLLAPLLIPLTPAYVWWVDHTFGEDDVYARLGAWLLRRGPRPSTAELSELGRVTVVKAFFFPLMFVYATRATEAATVTLAMPWPDTFVGWYRVLYDTAFLIDLALTSVGYAFALRLVGTHVRTAEPTALGWAACLVCYQPFWSIVGTQYLAYETDDVFWDQVFAGAPIAQAAWGVAVLACIGVYVWASMSFGLRFSNLSNRGIITAGPYRWVKHPAYVAKNLSWWLVSVPFLSHGGMEAARSCCLLMLLNGVYAVRAWTEERHLAADPDYVAYQAWIDRHGLWARLLGKDGTPAPTVRGVRP